jgi:hypothetical protein
MGRDEGEFWRGGRDDVADVIGMTRIALNYYSHNAAHDATSA